ETATAERDSALAELARAKDRRPAVVERVVREAGPDSSAVREAVAIVVDSIEVHEIRPLREALGAQRTISLSLTAQRDAALAANEALRKALDAARHEASLWESASKRS